MNYGALEPAPPAIIAAAAKQQEYDNDEQKCRGVHSDLLALSGQPGGANAAAYKARPTIGLLFFNPHRQYQFHGSDDILQRRGSRKANKKGAEYTHSANGIYLPSIAQVLA